ncbi:unnamed protein product, partial [Brenthis ino]
MRRATIVTFFIALTCIRCEAPDGYVIDESTGIGYKIIYQSQTWQVAKKRCEENGATLAVPKSIEEFKFMQKLVRAMYLPNITNSEFKLIVWLGINNLEDYRIWRNIYGENIEETGFHKWADSNGNGFSDEPAEPHCAGLDAVNWLRDFWSYKMNLLRKGMSMLTIGFKSQCTSLKAIPTQSLIRQVPPISSILSGTTLQASSTSVLSRTMASLAQMHKTGPHIKKRKSRNPLNGNPFAKGVVLKTLIKKPKKPNSANRKCVLVRLSNGREMVAYVPGIGHNLQEHNIVLVRVGRVKDCPGVKLKCVRGKFDLPHVVKQKQ